MISPHFKLKKIPASLWSLENGSLITSKPNDQNIQRTRGFCAVLVRTVEPLMTDTPRERQKCPS